MRIQRALIASTYLSQPASLLKLICIKRGKVEVEHDVSNGAICCSLGHTAPNYILHLDVKMPVGEKGNETDPDKMYLHIHFSIR